MLKKLKIDKFTAFSQGELYFSSQLTVCIGENATGKSHILKLAYAILRALAHHKQDTAKDVLARRLAGSLFEIFKPDQLGRLVTRRVNAGQTTCCIEALWGESGKIIFKFSTRAKELVEIKELNFEPLPATALFIPPQEILSVFNGFQAALEDRELRFDATYLDLAKALSANPLKGPRLEAIGKYLEPIEEAMGGMIKKEQGGFYFSSLKGKGTLESPLLAEGHKKIGMLAYLLRNGTLIKKSMLFWDEPEANMNPRWIRFLAKTLFDLSKDMQVIIATHSLFLLKEFEILAQKKSRAMNVHFIGLGLGEDDIYIEQAESLEGINTIVALEEELDQSDRFVQSGVRS